MLASLILVPIVSLLTRKNVPENVEKMFSCYDTTVMVPAKQILTDSEEK